MRHGISKRRFRSGIDANSMLLRKLVINFIKHGSIVTSRQKTKYSKPTVDRIIAHAKKDSRASMNVLTSFFTSKEVSQNLKDAVTTVFKDRSSCFTTAVKMGR